MLILSITFILFNTMQPNAIYPLTLQLPGIICILYKCCGSKRKDFRRDWGEVIRADKKQLCTNSIYKLSAHTYIQIILVFSCLQIYFAFLANFLNNLRAEAADSD